VGSSVVDWVLPPSSLLPWSSNCLLAVMPRASREEMLSFWLVLQGTASKYEKATFIGVNVVKGRSIMWAQQQQQQQRQTCGGQLGQPL